MIQPFCELAVDFVSLRVVHPLLQKVEHQLVIVVDTVQRIVRHQVRMTGDKLPQCADG